MIKSINTKKGFSLLEITVVLIIISILLSAVIPVLSRTYLEKAAQKTALDISTIEDASRKFYIDNNRWPDNLAALQANDAYLPSQWIATNPFVNYEPDLSDFYYYIKPIGSSLEIHTNVPTDAQPIIENLLSGSWVDQARKGNNVYSSISVPGEINVLPTGSILSWTGTEQASLGSSFLLCNGEAVSRTQYASLFAVIGTSYGAGDGSTTFNVPDLMGRTIVGVDGMGGVPAQNRISAQGLPNLIGNPNLLGSTFGEDKHELTTNELPNFNLTEYINSDGGGWSTAPRYNVVGSYNTSGAGNFQTGLPTSSIGNNQAHNVVQPSMTLAFIIKT